MSELKNLKSAQSLLGIAERAARQIKGGWVERLFNYLERKRYFKELEAGRELCRAGTHDFENWQEIVRNNVFTESVSKSLPIGVKYVYKATCTRCRTPNIRVLHDYKSN